jgi:multiple sugar transport system substrate-binding protein/raffinose/stachyose/melibiose transport system substrate-binding protein
MRVNGPEFHINLMLGKESYTDPKVKKIFTDYWAPLIKKGYFIDNPASYAWAEAIPFMADESAAMYLMGDFIRDSFPDSLIEDLDFFRFPIIDPSLPVGEDAPTDGYFIPKNAQNPELAKALITYIGSAEYQTYTAKKLNRLNTNSDVDITLFSDSQQKGIKMIQGADYVAQFYDRDTTPEMANVGMNGFMEFWANPEKIDSILAKLEKTRKEVFTEE